MIIVFLLNAFKRYAVKAYEMSVDMAAPSAE